jgi:hypothetical protein
MSKEKTKQPTSALSSRTVKAEGELTSKDLEKVSGGIIVVCRK